MLLLHFSCNSMSVSYGTDQFKKCDAVCERHTKGCIIDHRHDTPHSSGHVHLDLHGDLCFF